MTLPGKASNNVTVHHKALGSHLHHCQGPRADQRHRQPNEL